MNEAAILTDNDLAQIEKQIESIEAQIATASEHDDLSFQIQTLEQLVATVENSFSTICKSNKVVRLF